MSVLFVCKKKEPKLFGFVGSKLWGGGHCFCGRCKPFAQTTRPSNPPRCIDATSNNLVTLNNLGFGGTRWGFSGGPKACWNGQKLFWGGAARTGIHFTPNQSKNKSSWAPISDQFNPKTPNDNKLELSEIGFGNLQPVSAVQTKIFGRKIV